MSTSNEAAKSSKEAVLSVSKGKGTAQNKTESPNPQQIAKIREEERQKVLAEIMEKKKAEQESRSFEEIQTDFEVLKRKMSQREAIKDYLLKLAKVVIDPGQTNCQLAIHIEGEEIFMTQNPQFLGMVKDSAKTILENRLKDIEDNIRQAA